VKHGQNYLDAARTSADPSNEKATLVSVASQKSDPRVQD